MWQEGIELTNALPILNAPKMRLRLDNDVLNAVISLKAYVRSPHLLKKELNALNARLSTPNESLYAGFGFSMSTHSLFIGFLTQKLD